MVVFPPIFNIAPQRLNTAAQNFVRVFRRLNRTRLLKKNQRNPIRNAPENDMVVFPPIFNIAPQRLNAAARKFERRFCRLIRTRS